MTEETAASRLDNFTVLHNSIIQPYAYQCPD
jgi:hypothetical protein